MDERLLKRYLSEYNKNLEIKKDLEDRLLVAKNNFEKPSGGWVAKMPSGSPPDPGMVIVTKMANVDLILKDLKKVDDEIAEVRKFLGLLSKMEDYKAMIEDKYIREIGGYELSEKYGYTVRHLDRIIDRAITTAALLESMEEL